MNTSVDIETGAFTMYDKQLSQAVTLIGKENLEQLIKKFKENVLLTEKRLENAGIIKKQKQYFKSVTEALLHDNSELTADHIQEIGNGVAIVRFTSSYGMSDYYKLYALAKDQNSIPGALRSFDCINLEKHLREDSRIWVSSGGFRSGIGRDGRFYSVTLKKHFVDCRKEHELMRDVYDALYMYMKTNPTHKWHNFMYHTCPNLVKRVKEEQKQNTIANAR
jgi:hypothetical protein